jgi:hypothetical protein
MKTVSRITIAALSLILAFNFSAKTSFAAPNIIEIRDSVKENISKNRNARNESLEAPEKSFVSLATTSIANLLNIDSRIISRTEEQDVLGKDTSDVYANLANAEIAINEASTTLVMLQATSTIDSASSTHEYAIKVIGLLDRAKESLKQALQALKDNI